MFKKYKENTTDLKSKDNNKFFNLFLDFAQLKNIYRQGWVKYHNIDKKVTESVADHSFSMAVLAYILATEERPELDANKILKMALFHEIGEIYVGDIPLHEKKNTRAKVLKQEAKALDKVLKNFKSKKEVKKLWEEMEEQKTKEAIFVKELDNLEATFQAKLYQMIGNANASVNEFSDYSKKKIKNKKILKIISDLKMNN